MTIKLIVGLANPGKAYSTTRHNIGAWYIELLAKRFQKILKKESKFYGYTCRLIIGSSNVYLLIPTTFMNLSGTAVRSIASFYHINPEEILIAHDELNLLPGRCRLKLGGSHGGHNGLKNIISNLNNDSFFYRLRIGIGHPGNKKKVVDFVLNTPHETELKLIHTALNRAVYCTEILLNNQDIVKAINYLHTL